MLEVPRESSAREDGNDLVKGRDRADMQYGCEADDGSCRPVAEKR
jgi:hypothetical protein